MLGTTMKISLCMWSFQVHRKEIEYHRTNNSDQKPSLEEGGECFWGPEEKETMKHFPQFPNWSGGPQTRHLWIFDYRLSELLAHGVSLIKAMFNAQYLYLGKLETGKLSLNDYPYMNSLSHAMCTASNHSEIFPQMPPQNPPTPSLPWPFSACAKNVRSTYECFVIPSYNPTVTYLAKREKNFLCIIDEEVDVRRISMAMYTTI